MVIKRKEYTWYNFNRLYSYNATINMVVGGRGIGKSYGKKKRAVNNWIKKKEQFILVRRFNEELKAAKRTFFADFEKEFPDWDMRAQGVEAQIAPISTRDQKGREWETMGFFVALSTTQSQKSQSFPNVTTIFFDEFILEPGYQRYIPNEVTALLSFYETVDRGQERTKLYLLANAVSIMNPYFLHWGIRPDEVKGEWLVLAGGFVVVHFPNDEDFKRERADTKFGKFIEGTDYGNYATNNEFADNHDAMVGPKDSKARYRFSLETTNGTFHVWKNMFDGEYYIKANAPKAPVMYTLLASKMTHDKTLVSLTSVPIARMRHAFNNGRMTFDDKPTRNTFSEIFKR